jgi:hypothetical protein
MSSSSTRGLVYPMRPDEELYDLSREPGEQRNRVASRR